tara:strand:+ start:249 stop:599 length:351 start_codon:yes stop_codon:yes gene_type:complete
MRLELPWPPTKLNPNRSRNRMERYRLAAKYKSDCFYAARADGARPMEGDSVEMVVTFCPPNKQARDMDNTVASFKAGQDGISDALGVDDSRFVPTYRMGDPVKGGAVVVEIEGSQP